MAPILSCFNAEKHHDLDLIFKKLIPAFIFLCQINTLTIKKH